MKWLAAIGLLAAISLVIAAGARTLFRYEIAVGYAGGFLLDRWTGDVDVIRYDGTNTRVERGQSRYPDNYRYRD